MLWGKQKQSTQGKSVLGCSSAQNLDFSAAPPWLGRAGPGWSGRFSASAPHQGLASACRALGHCQCVTLAGGRGENGTGSHLLSIPVPQEATDHLPFPALCFLLSAHRTSRIAYSIPLAARSPETHGATEAVVSVLGRGTASLCTGPGLS
jgi:hypothetical protein